jgi:hypothetical protein
VERGGYLNVVLVQQNAAKNNKYIKIIYRYIYMNFSNENLLIIIVLISIVIMFLTSNSICKNQEQFSSCKNREQFNDSDNARRYGIPMQHNSSIFEIINVCDDVKCKGKNPEICTGDECVPVVTGGLKFNNCKYKTERGCVAGYDNTPINIDPCGKRTPKICTTSNCCDIKQLKKFNK